jgi:hypothetical protein
METLPISIIWRAMSWLPGFILRRFFSKLWLAQHTHLDVRPRHDPVSVYGGELPAVHIWLVVSNRGYFTIELDRLTVEFNWNAVVVRFHHLSRVELKPNAETAILIRGVLTTEQIAHISKNRDRPAVALQLEAEFNSKVHNFSVNTGQLTGIKPELLNV